MSSDVKQSENYVWSTNDVLGCGATSRVYKGYDKRNGKPVAIKSFNAFYERCSTKNREFEVLKKVNHENIVKLLAIETEVTMRNAPPRQIIVTELCTGGCLSEILETPENWHGLNDSDFLLILSHLNAGIKYLRDNNLIHRDLKPGNIMKCVKEEDGTVLYKLVDFGGARELSDEKDFKSLFGTEEYLNPHMYETAILRIDRGKTFKATVDLWSIGVTLYHIATGEIPFRPYKGRKDRPKMFDITTKKDTGVISGVQYESNGAIIWSKTLPKTCRLSESLQNLITPIIAGLLESETEKTWTFQQFFDEVDAVLTKKPLYVFSIYTANLRKLYLSPGGQLKQAIQKSTGVAPEDQILVYRSQIFDADTGDLPTTTSDLPLLLLVKDNANVISYTLQIPKYSLNFTLRTQAEMDDKLAKQGSFWAHQIKRLVEECVDNSNLIYYAVKNLSDYINQNYKHIDLGYIKLKEIVTRVKRTVEFTRKIRNFKLSSVSADELDAIIKLFSVTTRENLKNSWEAMISRTDNTFQTSARVRAQKLVEQYDDARIHLITSRNIPVSYTEQYKFEKKRMKSALDSLMNLLESEVYPQAKQFSEKFSVWYSSAQNNMEQMKLASASLVTAEEKLKTFELKLEEDLASFNENINVEKKKSINGIKSGLRNKLKEYKGPADSKNIIQESKIIMENALTFELDIDKLKIHFD